MNFSASLWNLQILINSHTTGSCGGEAGKEEGRVEGLQVPVQHAGEAGRQGKVRGRQGRQEGGKVQPGEEEWRQQGRLPEEGL